MSRCKSTKIIEQKLKIKTRNVEIASRRGVEARVSRGNKKVYLGVEKIVSGGRKECLWGSKRMSLEVIYICMYI